MNRALLEMAAREEATKQVQALGHHAGSMEGNAFLDGYVRATLNLRVNPVATKNSRAIAIRKNDEAIHLQGTDSFRAMGAAAAYTDFAGVDEASPAPASSLVPRLSTLLADAFSFYLQAHGAHWNVVGPDFGEYHALFQKIYEESYEVIDPLAEILRKLGGMAPFELGKLDELSTIPGKEAGRSANALATSLLEANSALLAEYKAAFDAATAAREQGICNFLADQIDNHETWRWQLAASLGMETPQRSVEKMETRNWEKWNAEHPYVPHPKKPGESPKEYSQRLHHQYSRWLQTASAMGVSHDVVNKAFADKAAAQGRKITPPEVKVGSPKAVDTQRSQTPTGGSNSMNRGQVEIMARNEVAVLTNRMRMRVGSQEQRTFTSAYLRARTSAGVRFAHEADELAFRKADQVERTSGESNLVARAGMEGYLATFEYLDTRNWKKWHEQHPYIPHPRQKSESSQEYTKRLKTDYAKWLKEGGIAGRTVKVASVKPGHILHTANGPERVTSIERHGGKAHIKSMDAAGDSHSHHIAAAGSAHTLKDEHFAHAKDTFGRASAMGKVQVGGIKGLTKDVDPKFSIAKGTKDVDPKFSASHESALQKHLDGESAHNLAKAKAFNKKGFYDPKTDGPKAASGDKSEYGPPKAIKATSLKSDHHIQTPKGVFRVVNAMKIGGKIRYEAHNDKTGEHIKGNVLPSHTFHVVPLPKDQQPPPLRERREFLHQDFVNNPTGHSPTHEAIAKIHEGGKNSHVNAALQLAGKGDEKVTQGHLAEAQEYYAGAAAHLKKAHTLFPSSNPKAKGLADALAHANAAVRWHKGNAEYEASPEGKAEAKAEHDKATMSGNPGTNIFSADGGLASSGSSEGDEKMIQEGMAYDPAKDEAGLLSGKADGATLKAADGTGTHEQAAEAHKIAAEANFAVGNNEEGNFHKAKQSAHSQAAKAAAAQPSSSGTDFTEHPTTAVGHTGFSTANPADVLSAEGLKQMGKTPEASQTPEDLDRYLELKKLNSIHMVTAKNMKRIGQPGSSAHTKVAGMLRKASIVQASHTATKAEKVKAHADAMQAHHSLWNKEHPTK